MHKYRLPNTNQTGIVDVTRKEDLLEVVFQDGTLTTISNDHKYDRYFARIHTLLGLVNKDDNGCYLMIAPYVMLHNHGECSLLDGLSNPKKIAKKLLRDDEICTPFFALTDHGLASGLPAFDKELLKNNLYPINGVEVYAEALDGSRKNHHLILLAKNKEGYKNLSHICTEAQENFYRHANVTEDMLRRHSNGLVCMSACLAGELPQHLLSGNTDKAEEFIRVYKEIFGDDFYIEIQNHGIEDENKIRDQLVDIARKNGVKIVATTDSHYVDQDDSYAHEVILAVGTKATMQDPDRFKFDGYGYHILNAEEFYSLFYLYPDSISNAFEIAKKCNFHFEKTKIEMPHFDIPDGYTEYEYFDKLVYQGFNDRFSGMSELTSQEYQDRLKYELSVIHQMGFEGYLLIVQDFINWAKSQDIAVGPGRGSAVGSLISYCLGITDLDPIPYDLLFERFLNPERVSMPDIDVDFSDERRPEVIEYVRRKYGQDHVSRIITFGTLAAKQSVKDVGRVLGFPPTLTQKIADTIPSVPGITLEKALEESPDFKTLYETDNNIHNIVDIAKKIEGTARNMSQHACGVVIAKNPVADNIPEVLLKDTQGNPAYTAAFQKDEVEDNGCIKFDFLGLRNMSILQNAANSIGIDYRKIPIFDPEVYAYIGTGNTEGIFQIESPGMQDLVRNLFGSVKREIKNCATQEARDRLGKECFERLVAAVALYRPGPIDYIPDYLANMRDPDNIVYDTPELKPILNVTYGTITYQEQVQQICRSLAGYSYGRADLIRRGMAKKKPEIIAKEKDIFLYGNKKAYDAGKESTYVPGCVANGINKDAALTIWAKMEKFAEYA